MISSQTTTIVLVLAGALAISTGLTACAHKEPKSSFRIIPEGDRNPNIVIAPERAGERVHQDDRR
jgi:hypothetical protein